jgi:hypothetical protein
MVSVESVPPSADVAISTKNTFIHVHGQNFNAAEEPSLIVTQSAPPVYRYPEPDDLPSTPEVWSIKPMPTLAEEETGKATVVAPDQTGPFPTLGLDDEPQASITDPDDKETISTNTSNGLSANARPFVPSKKQTNGTAAQLTTPHEKACADTLKASLAALFRDIGGVMFMLTRFGPYAFSVRLRMPAGADLQESATQIAYKKNYPSQFFVSESSVALPVVHLTVHYNDGSFGGNSSWDICWDFVKTGECKRANSCRWPHVPGAYFTIALENAPA